MLRKKEKEHRQEKNEGFNLHTDKLLVLFFLLLSIYLLETSGEFVIAQDKDLGTIEEKIFHQKFEKEPKEERVSRLEDFLFGTKHSGENLESRTTKIFAAIEPPAKEPKSIKVEQILPKIEPERIETDKQGSGEPNIVYDEAFNTGVVGAISQIESKVFNKTFNNLSFPIRVVNLEEKLLSRPEIIKNRKKPLIERVTILVQKAGLPVQKENPPVIYPPQKSLQNNYQYKPQAQSYTVDPNTGLLINEQTGQPVKDNYGNPITVRLPQPLPQPQGVIPQDPYGFLPQQNQLNQYGFPNQLPTQRALPGQLPLDLFNQLNSGQGSEPEY